MNANWPRWILASTSKVFQTAATAFPIHMYLEGTERRTDTHSNYIEFRLNGPRVTEVSSDYFKLEVEINVLFAVTIEDDFHMPQKVIGMLLETMADMCVYKYGDDSSLVGKLVLKRTPINVIYGNQTKAEIEIVQGLVSGFYTMYLTGA